MRTIIVMLILKVMEEERGPSILLQSALENFRTWWMPGRHVGAVEPAFPAPALGIFLENWVEGGKNHLDGIQLSIRWVVFCICDTLVFSLPWSEIFLKKLLFVLSLRSFGTRGDTVSQDDICTPGSLPVWKMEIFRHLYERSVVRWEWGTQNLCFL